MDKYLYLLANPSKNNKYNSNTYKDINYLKLYINKKFEKEDKITKCIIYTHIDNYINSININELIINDIIDEIIKQSYNSIINGTINK